LPVVALLLLPAAECAGGAYHQIATTLVSPKILPKLDFAKGIPADPPNRRGAHGC